MSIATFEPGQIPQQSGRFRTRRQDAPPPWTPGGSPPNPRTVFFVPPPPQLGAVLQGESDLEVGKNPSSGTGLKIVGASLLGPLFGFVTLVVATILLRKMGNNRPDDTTPFLALGGAALGIIVGWLLFGRSAGTECFYVCEGGVVQYFVNGSVIEGEVLYFREAANLHHDITRTIRKGSTIVRHDYVWRSGDGRKLYAVNYLEYLGGLRSRLANGAAEAWARWKRQQG